jgi:anti-sigma-K factor RskA
MTHQDFKDALPAFALDALDPAERAAVAAHLLTCAECEAELAALYRVADGIGLEAQPVVPPALLRSRVLAGIGGDKEVAVPPAAPATASRTWRTWALPVALAASVAVAAFALYQTSLARTELEPLRRMERVLGAADLVRADLVGQGSAAEASARALWSPSEGLVFTAANLPPLPLDRVYQLWTIRGSQPTSAGLLARGADGSVTFVRDAEAAGPPDAFGVTIEPAGGSATPTLPIVLVGGVR